MPVSLVNLCKTAHLGGFVLYFYCFHTGFGVIINLKGGIALQAQYCNLCPRKCQVDRNLQKGVCGVCGDKIRIGRASLHMWEEPCISGEKGSGTIFFAGCNLRCIYCQNYDLSQNLCGIDITTDQLAKTMIDLQHKGAHNINLVTPTHYSAQIVRAIELAREKGLILPIVYNTSGYESVSAIDSLKNLISVYLTDFKYADNDLAKTLSGVSDYFDVAIRALRAMVAQVGDPVYDENDMLIRGVIVRHLILPGHIQDSKDILSILYNEFGDHILLSIMNQYTPIRALPFEELNRCLTEEEYNEVVDYALSIGITNAFIQEMGTQSDSFIPDFNGEGIINDTNTNG